MSNKEDLEVLKATLKFVLEKLEELVNVLKGK